MSNLRTEWEYPEGNMLVLRVIVYRVTESGPNPIENIGESDCSAVLDDWCAENGYPLADWRTAE